MRRQLTKIALAASAILFTLGANTAFAECNDDLFAGGTGTEEDPYQISTAEQLQNLNECLGKDYKNNHYVLNDSIDLTSYLSGDGNNDGAGWQPIGTLTLVDASSFSSFYGKFNGNGHKIFGLWINRPSAEYVGLFGSVLEGADIRNIGVEIDNTNGGVKGKRCVGGLAGYVGSHTTISDSYTTGQVTGSTYVGGLVGTIGGKISNSYATGSVSGNEYVGGLAGQSEGASDNIISNSYATGNVTGSDDYIGGLVGRGYIVSNSYATGSVVGKRYVGGLAGGSIGKINSSYATGNVTGSSSSVNGNFIGGFVGINSGLIDNCFATANVISIGSYVGGFVGENRASTINNSYATGNVSGGSSVGGFAGGTRDGGKITNSYYDNQTSGQTDTGKGEGKPTAEMKIQTTFIDWDFAAIWEINPAKNNGYPILQNMTSPTPIIPNRKTPAIGNIIIQTTPNAILLSNIPTNTKITAYNLQGKQIHSSNSGNSQILRIPVQTGVYIIKAGAQTMRVAVR